MRLIALALKRPISVLIIIAALASQSSAAVADLNGAGGLLSESLGKRFTVRMGNLLTALVAIAITWSANIYEIITYASKAFIAYYALQAIQATLASVRHGHHARALLFATGILLAIAAIVIGKPAAA